MARYQIVFRNGSGDTFTLVDDPSKDGEPITYLHQPLGLGATLKSNGNSWIVVDDSEHDGIRRFTCDSVENDPDEAAERQARRRNINEGKAVRAWPPHVPRAPKLRVGTDGATAPNA